MLVVTDFVPCSTSVVTDYSVFLWLFLRFNNECKQNNSKQMIAALKDFSLYVLVGTWMMHTVPAMCCFLLMFSFSF